MRMVSGSFNGTGSIALWVCCGFIPDCVKIWAVDNSEVSFGEWGRDWVAYQAIEGICQHSLDATNADVTPYTANIGIQPYEGGDLLTSSNQTSEVYGEGIYLGWDHADYRSNKAYGCLSDTIDTWSLDTSTATAPAGHWNEDVVASGSRIGEGSRMLIDETVSGKRKWCVIKAVTANTGEASDEVDVSRPIAAGEVRFISGMYSMAPIPVGQVTPAGFRLNVGAEINVNDEIQAFVAGTYDN